MVKINMLTYLTFELISLVDSGLSIPVKEVKRLCEEKRVFEELERRFPIKQTGLDLSLLKEDVRKDLDEIFQDMSLAIDERRKFAVQNNGLCLLITYAQEQIQREMRKTKN